MHINIKDIEAMDKIYRLNLINSITGIKPGNLIGTCSKDKEENLAIISSVVHLGSNPPVIGFVMRPTGEVARHTFENIISTKYYTINHIHSPFIQNAHLTSIKFDRNESEFEKCELTPQYYKEFSAPFVKESQVKYGLELAEIIDIHNGTKLVVGKILEVILDDSFVKDDGQIDLDRSQSVGISGLNRYYELNFKEEHPYARREHLLNLTDKKKG